MIYEVNKNNKQYYFIIYYKTDYFNAIYTLMDSLKNVVLLAHACYLCIKVALLHLILFMISYDNCYSFLIMTYYNYSLPLDFPQTIDRKSLFNKISKVCRYTFVVRPFTFNVIQLPF